MARQGGGPKRHLRDGAASAPKRVRKDGGGDGVAAMPADGIDDIVRARAELRALETRLGDAKAAAAAARLSADARAAARDVCATAGCRPEEAAAAATCVEKTAAADEAEAAVVGLTKDVEAARDRNIAVLRAALECACGGRSGGSGGGGGGGVGDEFLCVICTDLLAAAHALSCGHSFCFVCITRWFEARHAAWEADTCPTCRTQVCSTRDVRSTYSCAFGAAE